MPIVSSSYIIDAHPQRDGSRWVKESHIDDSGVEHPRMYKLSSKMSERDAQDRLAAHAVYLDQQLGAAETQRAEQAALEQKHAGVLDAAVKGGTLSPDEAEKLGLRDAKVGAVEIEVKL